MCVEFKLTRSPRLLRDRRGKKVTEEQSSKEYDDANSILGACLQGARQRQWRGGVLLDLGFVEVQEGGEKGARAPGILIWSKGTTRMA
jgi:hypothetical protein